jgi:hypothetical protein
MMVQLFRKDTPITEKVKILLPKILLTGFNLKSTMKKKKGFCERKQLCYIQILYSGTV